MSEEKAVEKQKKYLIHLLETPKREYIGLLWPIPESDTSKEHMIEIWWQVDTSTSDSTVVISAKTMQNNYLPSSSILHIQYRDWELQ